jgi:hypothetical protein
VAGIAATVATDLAAPDGHEGSGVAIRAPPCQDVAIRRLNDGEDVTGALVGHDGSIPRGIEVLVQVR